MTPIVVPTEALVAAQNAVRYEEGILAGLIRKQAEMLAAGGALGAQIDAQHQRVVTVRALEQEEAARAH